MMLDHGYSHDVENAAGIHVFRIRQFLVTPAVVVGHLDFTVDLSAICALQVSGVFPVRSDRAMDLRVSHLFLGDIPNITTLSFKDDTKLRGTPTICAETCPGEQHILDLTSRPWQGPPRSFFWCGGFPESGMRAPS